MTTFATDSRAATNQLLSVLRTGGWSVRAWQDFLVLATRRSVEQARLRPRAFAEVTVLHVVIALLTPCQRQPWVTISWALSTTHLGLLEDHKRLGLPNILSLLRANLPALEARVGPALPVLALGSDFLDGRLARATGVTTRFGAMADVFADTAVWTWFAFRHEPSAWMKAATIAAWAAPATAITAASFHRGQMVDLSRPTWARPGAIIETVLAARAVSRLRQAGRSSATGTEVS